MHVAAGLKFTQSSTSVWRLSPSRQRLFAVQPLNRQTLTAEYFQHIIITTTIIMFPAALLLTLGNRTDFKKKKNFKDAAQITNISGGGEKNPQSCCQLSDVTFDWFCKL